MTVYERLLNVQRDLRAPKGQKNSFGNYNYRSAEDIIEAVKPLLHENGLVMTIADDITFVGNDRFYVKSTVKVVDVKNPVDIVETTAFAREASDKKGMDDSQITGATSSYARKYALNGMFAIDDTKDADTDVHTVATGRDKAFNRASCIKYINELPTAKRDALISKYNKENGKKISDCKYMTNDFMEKVWENKESL